MVRLTSPAPPPSPTLRPRRFSSRVNEWMAFPRRGGWWGSCLSRPGPWVWSPQSHLTGFCDARTEAGPGRAERTPYCPGSPPEAQPGPGATGRLSWPPPVPLPRSHCVLRIPSGMTLGGSPPSKEVGPLPGEPKQGSVDPACGLHACGSTGGTPPPKGSCRGFPHGCGGAGNRAPCEVGQVEAAASTGQRVS